MDLSVSFREFNTLTDNNSQICITDDCQKPKKQKRKDSSWKTSAIINQFFSNLAAQAWHF